jgi:CarD family transcriptional regulator
MTKVRKNYDFRTEEYIVYPAHGVGQIVSIDKHEVAGIL